MRIKSMITKDYFLRYLNKIISPTISKRKGMGQERRTRILILTVKALDL